VANDVIPQRPYLMRAMHEWMTDSGQTPHIIVDASVDDVAVPQQHIQDGKIILNISYAAVKHLTLGNDEISFEARFSGSPFRVSVPISAVLGIYARESSHGMVFSDEETAPGDGIEVDETETGPAGSGRPHLRIIK
jgi:stringent starvation protein B